MSVRKVKDGYRITGQTKIYKTRNGALKAEESIASRRPNAKRTTKSKTAKVKVASRRPNKYRSTSYSDPTKIKLKTRAA